MDLVALFLLLLGLVGTVNCTARAINIHTCNFAPPSTLLCDWQGSGMYYADRPLIGIHQLVFSRFNNDGWITLERTDAPDLSVVIIKHGEVHCNRINAPEVKVYVNNVQCGSRQGQGPTSTADTGNTMHSHDHGHHTTDGMASESETPAQSASQVASATSGEGTTVKIMLTTGKNLERYPVIGVTWDTMTEIKTLLIIVISSIFACLLIFGIYRVLKFCISKMRTKKKCKPSDISSDKSIEIFKLEDFVNKSD